ncbi:hypothetical protein POX_b02581 [Penicillium oxalicum]|uniref:hypothetical protein n=1 Tax=Penicillium oxalicum TaxID=69781 RepID=UPI0020B69115|nr:hypothetical protein POX_b02581 [Penicillium oxalicum]KAI2792543.1 hypothetical protein POX_b02581 [Penicillium oxalicum]
MAFSESGANTMVLRKVPINVDVFEAQFVEADARCTRRKFTWGSSRSEISKTQKAHLTKAEILSSAKVSGSCLETLCL